MAPQPTIATFAISRLSLVGKPDRNAFCEVSEPPEVRTFPRPSPDGGIARLRQIPRVGNWTSNTRRLTMHLIPRRAMRRALLLLLVTGGLLAVPAMAMAHSDLSLTKVVDHAEAAPGDLLVYTIQIQNHGTHASQDGAVTDTLPAHTTFVSATGGCTAAAGII